MPQFDIRMPRERVKVVSRILQRGVVQYNERLIRSDACERIDQIVCVAPNAWEMILNVATVNTK